MDGETARFSQGGPRPSSPLPRVEREEREGVGTLLSADFVSGLCLAGHVTESTNMVEFPRCSLPQALPAGTTSCVSQ